MRRLKGSIAGWPNSAARLWLIEQVATVCEQPENGAVTSNTSTTSCLRHHDMRVFRLRQGLRLRLGRCCRHRHPLPKKEKNPNKKSK